MYTIATAIFFIANLMGNWLVLELLYPLYPAQAVSSDPLTLLKLHLLQKGFLN